jgi:hypothetical protein
MGFFSDRFHVDDTFDVPEGGWFKRWLAGALIPGIIILFGASCIHAGRTPFPARHFMGQFIDYAGIALAVAYISVGLFLHLHFFWGLTRGLRRFAQPLKSWHVPCISRRDFRCFRPPFHG